MAKRADPGDETMELSTSQLVPDAPPRRRMPPPQISPQDASVWKQVVVGSNDFAPPPKARSGRARTWAIAGVAAAAVTGGGAYAWHRMSSDGAPAAEATASQPAVAKSVSPPPAEAKPAEPKPAAPAPAVAVETPAPAVEAPAPRDDEPPGTWLTDLVAQLSPPEAVTSLFAGLAPWTATTTATAKSPPPAAKKAPIVLKKPQLAPAAPKKPVAPAKRPRR